MSADPLQPVQPGQPLEIPAAAWNALTEMAKRERQGQPTAARKDPLGWGGVIEVQALNDTGDDLREYQPAKISSTAVGGYELPTNDTVWQRRPLFTLEVPDATTNFVAVALEAIPDGAIGRVAVGGAVLCDVDVTGGDQYATPAVGFTTKLTGGTTGSIRILHKPATGGSTYRCVVFLGDQFDATGGGGANGEQEHQFASGAQWGYPSLRSSGLGYGKATVLQGNNWDGTRGGRQMFAVFFEDAVRDMLYTRVWGKIEGCLGIEANAIPAGERLYAGCYVIVRTAKMYDWETGGTYAGAPSAWGASFIYEQWTPFAEMSASAPTVLNFSLPFALGAICCDHQFNYGTLTAFRATRINVEVFPVLVQSGSGLLSVSANYDLNWMPTFVADGYTGMWAEWPGRGDYYGIDWFDYPGSSSKGLGGTAAQGTRIRSAALPTIQARSITIPAATTTSVVSGFIRGVTAGAISLGAGVVMLARNDATAATTTATASGAGQYTFTALGAGNYEIYRAVGPDSLQPPSIRVYVPGDAYDLDFFDSSAGVVSAYSPLTSIESRYATIGGTVSGLGGTACRVVCWKDSDVIGTADQGPYSDADLTAFFGRDRFCCRTDTSGNYRLTGLPPGTYTVELDPAISGAHSPADYTGVVATAGVPVTGIDFN